MLGKSDMYIQEHAKRTEQHKCFLLPPLLTSMSQQRMELLGFFLFHLADLDLDEGQYSESSHQSVLPKPQAHVLKKKRQEVFICEGSPWLERRVCHLGTVARILGWTGLWSVEQASNLPHSLGTLPKHHPLPLCVQC